MHDTHPASGSMNERKGLRRTKSPKTAPSQPPTPPPHHPKIGPILHPTFPSIPNIHPPRPTHNKIPRPQLFLSKKKTKKKSDHIRSHSPTPHNQIPNPQTGIENPRTHRSREKRGGGKISEHPLGARGIVRLGASLARGAFVPFCFCFCVFFPPSQASVWILGGAGGVGRDRSQAA